jgi:hypothetical protein
MARFEPLRDLHRILSSNNVDQRIVTSSHTSSRTNYVAIGRVYWAARCAGVAFTSRVLAHLACLTGSMLVQFARDLGEDFYAKYWERTVILLSQIVNHSDFQVIEVRNLSPTANTGCVQCTVLAIEIPLTFVGR